MWADRQEDRSAFPIEVVGTERSFFCSHATNVKHQARNHRARRRLRQVACGNHHAAGTRVAGLRADPLSGRPVVRTLSLAWLSPESKAVLLRKRGNGPVLLSPLPPSRPPARTLGGGHQPITASRGYRPLCRVGPRPALDSALVIRTGASCTKQQAYRFTPPTTVQRRGHRYLRRASRDHTSLDYRDQKALNYRDRSHAPTRQSGA